MVRGRLLVTGGAGRIAQATAAGLIGCGWELLMFDAVAVPPGPYDAALGDITDRSALAAAVDGVDAVLHLAGIPRESTWAEALHTNIDGTQAVLDAARHAGVARAVLASSVHAAGFVPYPDDGAHIADDLPPRPDTFYGVSKAALEALGSLYHDRYGMDVVCIRIGSFGTDAPGNRTALRIWLSAADAVRLFDAALTAPGPLFRVVWGVSANTRRRWSLDAARSLGYDPQDDAEPFADRFTGEPSVLDRQGERHAGGDMTGPEYDVD